MNHTCYRLLLTAFCGLAAYIGPVFFLGDPLHTPYLLGGVGASLLTWLLLAGAMAAEPSIEPWLRGVIGLGAAVLSWSTVSLVAVFDVIPHMAVRGMDPFDPVWIACGLAPLAVPAMALLWVRAGRMPFWTGLMTALYRFSVPLFGVYLTAQLSGMGKQMRWLFLFTGITFLVLDGLGTFRLFGGLQTNGAGKAKHSV